MPACGGQDGAYDGKTYSHLSSEAGNVLNVKILFAPEVLNVWRQKCVVGRDGWKEEEVGVRMQEGQKGAKQAEIEEVNLIVNTVFFIT